MADTEDLMVSHAPFCHIITTHLYEAPAVCFANGSGAHCSHRTVRHCYSFTQRFCNGGACQMCGVHSWLWLNQKPLNARPTFLPEMLLNLVGRLKKRRDSCKIETVFPASGFEADKVCNGLSKRERLSQGSEKKHCQSRTGDWTPKWRNFVDLMTEVKFCLSCWFYLHLGLW